MHKRTIAAALAAGILGLTAPNVGASEVETEVGCTVGSWDQTVCVSNTFVGGEFHDSRVQVIAGNAPAGHFQHGAWLHVEWDQGLADCQVWEDLSGHCFIDGGREIGGDGPITSDFRVYRVDSEGRQTYTGADGAQHSDRDIPSYHGTVALGLSSHLAYHVYLPSPEDPQLQYPLVVFWPVAW